MNYNIVELLNHNSCIYLERGYFVMKKVLFLFSLVIIASLLITSTALAVLPGTGWWSAVFTQNISNASGSLSMIAYDASSSAEFSIDPIPFGAGTALVYDPGKTPGGIYIGFSPSLPGGFQGSVVLSTDVPAAAVSEIANYKNGPVGGNGTASARYTGMSQDDVANTLFVPSIKHNYVRHTTTLYVQAAGGSANVTVTYNMNDGNSYSQNVTIEENKMFVFDPMNAGVPSTGCGTDANVSPCAGSAQVHSTTGKIAGTVVEHQHVGSPASYAMSTRMQTDKDKFTKLYHPSVKNDYMNIMIAGASVMNTGSEPALVKITLTVIASSTTSAKPGDIFEDTAVIQPGQGLLFSKYLKNLGGMPKGTFAAAVVESLNSPPYTPQLLVGSTNDSKVMPKIRAGRGITLYSAFADNSTTSAIAAPIIRENIGGISGGLTVQNVGSADDTIEFWYYEYGTSNVYHFWSTNPVGVGQAVNTNRVAVNAGGRFTNDGSWAFSALNNKQFSVIAKSQAGQAIIGLASEYAMADDMDMRNFEAINFVP
jgi:hypothetical protein